MHSDKTKIVSPNSSNVIHNWIGLKWLTEIINQIDVFLLDFEKAFKTDPHKLVKTKLHSIGASKLTIKWINQFLDNRQQTAIVNGTASNSKLVASGVPQGLSWVPSSFWLI